MASRSGPEHRIEPTSAGAWSDCLRDLRDHAIAFVTLSAIVVVLAMLLETCGHHRSGSGSSSASSMSSGPSSPLPPPPQRAVFETRGDFANLAFTIAGGSTPVLYETRNPDELARELSGQESVYFVNFNDGTTRGDLSTATAIVVVGAVKVSIGSMRDTETLTSQIIHAGGMVDALFLHGHDDPVATRERLLHSVPVDRVHWPRGPPESVPRFQGIPGMAQARAKPGTRRVIVVGSLDVIRFGNMKGKSHHRLDVLDLGPSEEDERKYAERRSEYERDVRYHEVRYGTPEHPKPAYEYARSRPAGR